MWLLVIPLAFCAEASWHDLDRREIPDSVSLRTALTGLIATGLSWNPVSLPEAFLGMFIGFLVVFPLAWLGGMGGGDLKLVAALGPWLGPAGMLVVLFWTALAGMLMAAWSCCRRQKALPYAPAITAGLVVFAVFPGAVTGWIEWLRELLPVA